MLYLAEGDFGNAVISAGSAIAPVGGQALMGARLAIKYGDNAFPLGQGAVRGSDEAGDALHGFGEGTTFYHYTSAEGVRGITGIDPGSLAVGETSIVNELRFGTGQSPFLAREPGDIFVTDMGPNPSDLQFAQLGISTENRRFCIAFNQEAALRQGIRPDPIEGRPIYTIPSNSYLGPGFDYTVTRLR